VTIDVEALIPSYGSFQPGGSTPVDFVGADGENIVQAVAPAGTAGLISGASATLDAGYGLLGLTGAPPVPPRLARGLCDVTAGSSFAITGKGGLTEVAGDPLWAEDSVSKGGALAEDSEASHDRHAGLLAVVLPEAGQPDTAPGCVDTRLTDR
jgi:hypothetical protein